MPIKKLLHQEVSLESPGGLHAHPHLHPPLPALSPAQSQKSELERTLWPMASNPPPNDLHHLGSFEGKATERSGLIKATQQAGGYSKPGAPKNSGAKA